MLLVIDANELFSLLIRGSKESKEIIDSTEVELIAPELLLTEFSNNEEEILTKTHKTAEEFSKLLGSLKNRIRFICEQEFKEFIDDACKLFPEHTKDAPYLALGLKFNCVVWSEEKLLKKQSRIKVLNTKELSKLLE